MKSRILAFSGSKQAGKTTCSNFLHGYQLKCYSVIENFYVLEDGQLVVSTDVVNKDGQTEKANATLDTSRTDLDFAEWAIYSMWPFVKNYSFAAPLKEICIGLFGLTDEQCNGTDSQKNTLTNIKWGDIPGMTVAKSKKNKKMTAREFLQYFGTETCRKIKEDVWADRCIEDIESEEPLLAIIDDCRFPNEADAIQKAGGKVIRLTRSPHADKHSSESALDKWDNFDAVIDNSKLDINESCSELIEILDGWGWLSKSVTPAEKTTEEQAAKPELVGGIHTIKKAN
tara:strand:+ start:5019 stop:5873 length:855 start_codon:yes stop_codon:yes gene_type:complete